MIKAEGIHKTFEDFTALDNITCSISDGCIYGTVSYTHLTLPTNREV